MTTYALVPEDAPVRLVAARCNICLILLAGAAPAGRPDRGFLAVVGWSVQTAGVLVVRLLQGAITRAMYDPLVSRLSEAGVETGPHAVSFRVFAGTWSAYDV